MPRSIPTRHLVVSLRHLVSNYLHSKFVSFLLLFLCCQILDTSNLIYDSGAITIHTSRPHQTTLSFSQGHLTGNIVKSSPQLGECSVPVFFSQVLDTQLHCCMVVRLLNHISRNLIRHYYQH